MPIAADISRKTNDFDTLGGRLNRARNAKKSSRAEIAKLAGVESKTVKAWEVDQTIPRSNRLAMLAGILGVSPTWLLFGRGASPVQRPIPADVAAIELRLNRLKTQRQKISAKVEKAEIALQLAKAKNAS